MKIIRLEAQNVKRLRAVTITPDGNLVVLGGRNSQGKSSVLDSIMYALAGGRALPEQPVRRGAEKASVELDLGEILVKRTFTQEGGGGVSVTIKGEKQASPQAILDRLAGKLTFDPLSFTRLEPAKKAETLRAIASLDFTAIEQERAAAFAERTVANRDLSAVEARLKALPPAEPNLPEHEESSAAILAELEQANKANAETQKVRAGVRVKQDEVRQVENAVSNCVMWIDSGQKTVAQLEAQLEQARKTLADHEARLISLQQNLKVKRDEAAAAVAEADKIQDIPLTPFHERLQSLEQRNQAIRANAARRKLEEEQVAARRKVDKLTRAIEGADEQKRTAIAGATFPVPGLGFDLSGNITLDGIPFEQASESEKLKVSVGIGMALNPKLKVLLIRDGSLLDADSLALVAKLAAEKDVQVWIEVVRTDGTCSVVIEDGMVKEDEAQ